MSFSHTASFPSVAEVRQRAAAIAAAIEPPRIPDRELDLIAHSGLSPDSAGSVDFAPAVAAAIAELSAQGGGRLVFRHPAGAQTWVKPVVTYRLRGPLHLRSRISLELDPCTRLFFEFDPPAYSAGGQGVYLRYEGTSLFSLSPLIYAYDCEDIRIRARPGSGAPPAIDGDGERWQAWAQEGQQAQAAAGRSPSYERLKQLNNQQLPLAQRHFADPAKDFFRPTLLGLYFSRRILVENVRLQHSPFWVVHPVFCQDAVFRRLLFHAYLVNNDGIDPECCSRVLVEDVVFGNHDDNIAVKGGRDAEGREGLAVAGTPLADLVHPAIREGLLQAPTEDIVVRRCCFEGHYGFCVGSDLANTTRRVYAIDNVVAREVGMAVYVKSSRRRGARIHDVHVAGLEVASSRGALVCINANYDNDPVAAHPPAIGGITVREVRARQAGAGIVVTGWPDAPIGPVLIENLACERLESEDHAAAPKPLELLNAEAVTLRDVVLDGRRLPDETLHARSADAPPHQI